MTTPTPSLRALLATGATLVGLGGAIFFSPAGQSVASATEAVSSTGSSAGTSSSSDSASIDSGSASSNSSDSTGSSSSQNADSGSTSTDSGSGSSSSDSSTSSSSDTSSDSSSSTSSSGATDGTYTGTAYQSPYGAMQVQVTISGGSISDIEWVQLPQDGHSQRINSQAAPMLVSEALSAQSANVDSISGASFTSEGFKESLQSALDQAGYAS